LNDPLREGSATGWKPPYGESAEDHPRAASHKKDDRRRRYLN